MAQIIFSEVGAAVGRRVLPQGLSVLGRAVSGAAIGRGLGAAAGRVIDASFADAAEGPSVEALHVMEAREGAGLASVYGRMRVGGQVIWATNFKETRKTERAGGKGGPSVNTYTYTISFAVALGEGPVLGVQRAWANGAPFDLSGVTYRLHLGNEVQEPDPLIEMIEGAAPAYRGTAYIVFEDLPLEDFGNRLPQLSFEVSRVPEGGDEAGLAQSVTGVNIIPASGEFVYATQIVRERIHAGAERAINANSGEARADFLVSLDQMETDVPRAKRAALTVGWFGTDMLVGACEIHPGIETRERITVPYQWSVAGIDRANAYVISRDANGAPNYGGTPADRCVVEAIAEMKQRGIAVTLSPFLFMDTAGFPWRGRLGVAADGTASARADVDTFVNGPNGFRRFILHHAGLAVQAGGVESFLIGSEMRALTRVRDEAGAFPFVEALVSLAVEVKAILPNAKVSYAADWTEYGAYVPPDASGDVLFPLDDLWASPHVDFVGIDWYPPIGDWREGGDHLDAQIYASADDAAYLQSQIEGEEAYDWYYASQADRDAQIRTPIVDTAHGEDWIFRAKDLTGWSGNVHHARPGGVRAGAPTAWVAGSKPIRLSEIGFSAVDKGGNAPNVFFDPKSVESALPPYSNGARDDVFQKRALAAVLGAYEANPLIEASYVWAWDGRPFPAWPLREDVWADGGNWARGHWLNGRSGLAPLGAVVGDICARGGVLDVDASGLDGVVEGYALGGVHSVRAALEPLKAAFGFEAIERAGVLVFRMLGEGVHIALSTEALVGAPLQVSRNLLDKAPERLNLTYVDLEADYQPAIAEARRGGGDPRLSVSATVPLAMNAKRAQAVARYMLARSATPDAGQCAVPLAQLGLEPGDTLSVDDGAVWRVADVTDAGAVRTLELVEPLTPPSRARAMSAGSAPRPVSTPTGIDLVVMDGPLLPTETEARGPLVAAWAQVWPGEVSVLAGGDESNLSVRATLTQPATIARLTAACEAGPVGRWDMANVLQVFSPAGGFASLPEGRVLSGGNAALLETDAGWELVQFASAELIGPDQWWLSGLLRGQQGSLSGQAAIGARLVLLDGSAVRAAVTPEEIGSELVWRSGAQALTYEDRAHLPWPVAHLRESGGVLSWVRRGVDVPVSWAFPEAVNVGRFVVAFDMGAGFGAANIVEAARAAVPSGAVAARVAEQGADGRTGPWVSIGLGTP